MIAAQKEKGQNVSKSKAMWVVNVMSWKSLARSRELKRSAGCENMGVDRVLPQGVERGRSKRSERFTRMVRRFDQRWASCIGRTGPWAEAS